MDRAFTNDHWLLEEDDPSLIVIRRTPAPYTEAARITASFAELERVLKAYDRDRFRLLLDMRAAPPRNDPEFERIGSPQVASFARAFHRVAILTKTAAGRLQVARHIQTWRVQDHVDAFHEEELALRYLRD
jgi:hypothetical protein